MTLLLGTVCYQSLSASDLEDSLEYNIHYTQAMWAQIAAEISKLQEEPTQQAEKVEQVSNLQAQDHQLAEIMEEEMTHCRQMSVFFQMPLQQAEEVNAQSQEIQCLLALVEQQQDAIQILTCPKSPPRKLSSHSESQLDIIWEEMFNLIQGSVNTRQDVAVVSHSLLSTPMINKDSFEDILPEEAN